MQKKPTYEELEQKISEFNSQVIELKHAAKQRVKPKSCSGDERYRQLFEHMSSGVAVYEITDGADDFVFRDFNRAAERIEGIGRKDILGKRVTDVFPNVKEFGLFEVLERVWRTGEPEYFEPHLYTDDRGPGTWRESWVYKLSGSEVVAIYNDITDRKWAENELKNNQELLSEMTRRVPGIIYQFYSRPNGEMGLHYVSEGAEQVIGLKADTHDFFERFTKHVIPEHRDAFIESIHKAVEGIKPWHFEGILQKPTGERIFFSGDSTPSVRETEVVFNGIILDISKQKEAEKEHKKLQAQLLQSEKMASVGQLAAGVAHEINNPTGFVGSNLNALDDYQKDITELLKKYQELFEFLKQSPDNEKMSSTTLNRISDIIHFADKIDIDYILEDFQKLINDCLEGVDRIKKIVIDLKDFAHPGEDKLKLTDINKNITSTLNVIWNEIKYHVDVKKKFGKLPMVMCYPHQLNQVFMNIIINAAQAIAEKGEITITTKDAGQYVIIEIQDTGCGIEKEILNKIYDPFFTTKDIGKGTGLGLNVVYNIIKKHNGKINVVSEVGKGTLFTIHIPVEAS